MDKKLRLHRILFLFMGMILMTSFSDPPVWGGDGMTKSINKASKSIRRQLGKGAEVLVTDFKNIDNEDIALGRVLADHLRITLVRQGLTVLDGGNLDVLQRNFEQTNGNGADIHDQGGLNEKIKPPYLVRGTIVELAAIFQLHVEMVEVEKGQIVGGVVQDMEAIKLHKDLVQLEASDDRENLSQIKREAQAMEAAVRQRIASDSKGTLARQGSVPGGAPVPIATADFHTDMQKKIDRQFNALLPSGGSNRRKIYELDRSAPTYAMPPQEEDVAHIDQEIEDLPE